MHDKRFPKWRSWVAGALLLFVTAIIALGWPREKEEPVAPIVVATEPATLAPPAPLQILNRSALIEAAAKAASAYAAGTPMDNAAMELAGRRFELILPLGCSGPLPTEAPIANGWSYDAETEILQVAFASTLQGLPDNFFGDGSEEAAKVELGKGFWIEREWLRDAVCPADVQNPAMNIVADAPSLAIAEIGEAEEPRAKARDGSDYRVSTRISVEEAPDQQGLRISISGRLATNSVPIKCRSTQKDKRPLCVILARFDRVALANRTGSEIYGEWLN